MFDRKNWNREYYSKEVNRIRKRKLWKEYYYRNREKRLEASLKYKNEHKDKVREREKKRYQRCKQKISELGKIRQKNNFLSWVSYFPKITNCQICERPIFFNQRNANNAIHFDHKNENTAIKLPPSTWLRSKKRTPETQKIWKSCNFGMLCRKCNAFLPTKNRKDFILRVNKYMEIGI